MKKLFLILFVAITSDAYTQSGNFWQVLAEVHFVDTKDKNGFSIEKPQFSKHLKSYNSKRIRLKGYLIPLSESGGHGKFMLSSLPFNVCFFCGAAGPETVIELDTKEPLKFSTKQIEMEGELQLNASDPDHHIYILKSAVLRH
jgi:hypothetical protein